MTWRVWVVLAWSLALFGGGYWRGHVHEANACQAEQRDQDRAVVSAYHAGVARGSASSGRLAQAETAIQIKTVERIKYVPQVTAGRRCLEPAAVGLLNGSAAPSLPSAAGQPATADAAAPAASDADVAGWIAAAGGQYETCAARLNGLIDYEEAKP